MRKKPIENRRINRNLIKEVFCFNGKFDFLALIKNILISIGGGVLVSLLVYKTINVYNGLKKPNFTPPNIVFVVLFSIIYITIGIAAYRIYMNNKLGRNDFDGYFYYLIGLLLNFLWPIIFFGLRLYGIAFILTIVLLIFIILTTIKFLRIDKIAGVLMVLYGLWMSFVSMLIFFIWMFNEM